MATRSLPGAFEDQIFVYGPFGADEVVSRVEAFVDVAAKVLWCLAGYPYVLGGVFSFRSALPDGGKGKDADENLVEEMHSVGASSRGLVEGAECREQGVKSCEDSHCLEFILPLLGD